MSKAAFVVLAAVSIMSCVGEDTAEKENMIEEHTELPSFWDVSASRWDELAKKRIYFGHQSVGFNIMAGVEEVLKQNPQIKLQVIESGDPADLRGGVFAHSKIGENNKPVTKMEGLQQYMKRDGGGGVDIAFVKLCFVDVMMDTDVEGLFEQYKATASSLKTAHPNTTFVHFTIPLRVYLPPSFKYSIRKRILGLAFADNAHNVARKRYNDLLREEYAGQEPIFDVAEAESTHLDGKRELYGIDGAECYALVRDYTDDGGHLNEVGRKHVAEQLLVFLANLR